MVALISSPGQLPLIEFIDPDDLYLQQQPDVLWFDVLTDLDYRQFQSTAARYFECLYRFNIQQAEQRRQRRQHSPTPNPETQQQATLRLLFGRPTLDKDADVLYQPPETLPAVISIRPQSLSPGVTPTRMAGKPPKCFFAMLNSFLGVMLAGQAPEPEHVSQKLKENPAYARTCGFTIPRPDKPSRQSDIPSLRKLQQFDQIMTDNDLWGELALDRVAENLRNGTIKTESTLVHDTTHYHANSAMRVVEVPTTPAKKQAADTNQLADASGDAPDTKTRSKTRSKAETKAKTKTKTKKRKTKSHPRTTKFCRCPQPEQCDHPWYSADDGAGTVFKHSGKMYWAHKASTLSFAGQEVLLDAVAMNDAASHDSKSLPSHLERLFTRHPDLKDVVNRVLDDSVADDAKLKQQLRDDWDIELLTPINTRRRGPIVGDLPRGIDHLTARGTPVCEAGHPFELQGFRRDTERFIFAAPEAAGVSVCQGCEFREGCYRGESSGRCVTISAERVPWLDRELPQLSKRFEKAMSRRTVIERLHKLMKFDFGDDRLSKRGTTSFQARLDKTLLAMHVLLGRPA